MKVLVIGGYGAFGERLCRMLAHDGHDVTVAGRSRAKAAVLAGEIGGRGVVFDRNGPLGGLAGYDAVVDAAGPFHTYGDDPYRIAKAAITAGVHYFDLSDNADFCSEIAVLDEDAKRAGVIVLSGMSSVPAISSAAVRALADGRPIAVIESAILPGNKAPRGRAVVESILNQAGTEYHAMEAGRSVAVQSWSEPRWFNLGAGLHRQGWRIEVPDQRLFPAFFEARTVTFRAGLELGLMRYGLGALAWVRSKFGFGMPSWLVSLVMIAANLLAPFGTDRGGMVVEVTRRIDEGWEKARWALRAKDGDGPFVPGVAVRAACRHLEEIARGARPALAVLPLDKIESAMEDLAIETEITREDVTPVFEQVLGERFDDLPRTVQATHASAAPRRYTGRASVTRGTGLQAKVAAALFGFPPSSEDVDVEVIKRPEGDGETWVRRFGDTSFRSHLRRDWRGMTERFGPFTFDLGLHVADGALHFPVRGGRFLGIPLARVMLPQSEAREYEEGRRFHFDVLLKAPTGVTLVHYRGSLAQAAENHSEK